MWENCRIDGSKKLRVDAVPIIFGDLVYQVPEFIGNIKGNCVDKK